MLDGNVVPGADVFIPLKMLKQAWAYSRCNRNGKNKNFADAY
jgi:hypothetical protein